MERGLLHMRKTAFDLGSADVPVRSGYRSECGFEDTRATLHATQLRARTPAVRSVTVPVAPFGVPPNSSGTGAYSQLSHHTVIPNAFGRRPKAARETTALRACDAGHR